MYIHHYDFRTFYHLQDKKKNENNLVPLSCHSFPNPAVTSSPVLSNHHRTVWMESQYVVFLPLSLFSVFIHVTCYQYFFLFLFVLINISLYDHTTFCLSIHPSVDGIWTISIFWLLWRVCYFSFQSPLQYLLRHRYRLPFGINYLSFFWWILSINFQQLQFCHIGLRLTMFGYEGYVSFMIWGSCLDMKDYFKM